MESALSLTTLLGPSGGQRQPCIVLAGEQRYELHDIRVPETPPPGYVKLRMRFGTICGTDYALYDGKFPLGSLPNISGHEGGGDIEEVGDGVTDLKVGDKVAIEPYDNRCGGTCDYCKEGRTGACEQHVTRGVMANDPGCWQTYYVVRADRVHVQNELSHQALALAEPLCVGHHALCRTTGITPGEFDSALQGEVILILGCGPIGAAVAWAAECYGMVPAIADISGGKLTRAESVLDNPTPMLFSTDGSRNVRQVVEVLGKKPRFVVDATGSSKSMTSALEMVSCGALGWVGITKDPIKFYQMAFHKPELTLHACRNASSADFEAVLSSMVSRRFDPGKWVTHHTSFERLDSDMPTFTQPGFDGLRAGMEIPDVL